MKIFIATLIVTAGLIAQGMAGGLQDVSADWICKKPVRYSERAACYMVQEINRKGLTIGAEVKPYLEVVNSDSVPFNGEHSDIQPATGYKYLQPTYDPMNAEDVTFNGQTVEYDEIQL